MGTNLPHRNEEAGAPRGAPGALPMATCGALEGGRARPHGRGDPIHCGSDGHPGDESDRSVTGRAVPRFRALSGRVMRHE